jgi:alpha-tubulin suppressor-like RCC1 family protein
VIGPAAAAATDGAATWGENNVGQLGDGTEVGPEVCLSLPFTYCSSTPVAVTGLSGVTAISTGTDHTLALMADGTVMAWGNNVQGQLGDGTTGGISNVPVPVKGLSGVTAISAGRSYSLALLSDGTVMAWGDNHAGELGEGIAGESRDEPVAVPGLSSVTAIAASEGTNVYGKVHSLALLSSGQVMAWGDNEHGELGHGTVSEKDDTPTLVTGLGNVTAVSAGTGYSLALLESGEVIAWGANEHGQLGDGGTEGSDLPVAVTELSGVTAVSAGAEHSLALLTGGTVMAWGENKEGQLGNGTNFSTSDRPVAVSGLSGVTAVSAGGVAHGGEFEHSLALLSNGTLMAWGADAMGQLGVLGRNGLAGAQSAVPIPVAGVSGVAGISAGGAFSASYGPPLPGVFSVSPSKGPETGGTSVTITGLNFIGATAVKFGSVGATSFVVNSATSITAVAPAETASQVHVTVTNSEGTSFATPVDLFSYGVPTVTRVKPNIGPVGGGVSVTITGTNFTTATAVHFGLVPATSFTVKSATSIVAVSPAEPVGPVDVTVIDPGGTSPIATADRFKVAPAVTGVSPNGGPTSGGTHVTITGTGFGLGTTATKFKFGTTSATGVNCESTTTCTVVAPAHAAAIVDVKATVNKVASPKNAPADHFTYS